jgi:DNA-binding transcriptional LysR family regulator
MELRQLEYVVAIADTGSFTRAGHRCHVVQSALSRQVARLETELGVRLFHRTTREVRLTAAGHAFLPAARRVLSEAARARAEATDAASVPRGQLRLGASQAASGSLDLAALLGEFRRRFPEVTVVITAGPRQELVTGVADGDLDLAFAAEGAAGDPAPDGTRFQSLLADEPLLAVVPAGDPLARRTRVSLAEIAGRGPCVEFRPGTELRRLVDAAFRSAGVSRTVAFELGQLTEMVRFARAGLGTAIVPRSFAADLAAGRPAAGVLELADRGLTMTIGAYRPAEAALPAARALLDVASRRDELRREFAYAHR